MKMTFEKLYQYSSHKKLKAKMKKYYEAKIVSKHFKQFCWIVKKLLIYHKGFEYSKKVIYNSIKENLKMVIKTIPIKLIKILLRSLKRRSLNTIIDYIKRVNDYMKIHYNNSLMERSIRGLRASCIATKNLMSARKEAIRKAGQKRLLRRIFKSFYKIIKLREKRLKSINDLYKIYEKYNKFQGIKKWRIQTSLIKYKERRMESNRNLLRISLKKLFLNSQKRIKEIKQYHINTLLKRTLLALNHISHSKKLRVILYYKLENTNYIS